MNEQEYLIGDVSELSGISRDTLRFYEKKGIISSKKKENGYRYYSFDEIFKLSNILYSRKMNICLEDIEQLWSSESSYHSMAEVAKRMIEKEQEDIKNHQQVLARLQITLEECQKIHQNLDKISLRTFPSAYLIKTCSSTQESLQEWFQLSAAHDGMDMVYTYDQYQHREDSLEFQGSCLLFDHHNQLHIDMDLSQFPLTKRRRCIYSMVETDRCAPPVSMVKQMEEWGWERGLKISGHVLSSMRLQTGRCGSSVYYLKLYMPVEET